MDDLIEALTKAVEEINMNYEKAYKEAIERARVEQETFINLGNISGKSAIERIFPELKESEDEKIRKTIIDFLKNTEEEVGSPLIFGNTTTTDMIAWLEKQGENKPVDKVEPKFKVGDWILYSGDHFEGVRHITKIDKDGYYIERNGLPHGIIPFNHEICMRLWTIQDAKDGDVLAIGNEYFLFKEKKENTSPVVCISHCFANSAGAFRVTNGRDCGEFLSIENGIKACPATKEQCALLFQNMKEAGYEWDAEKKELKKIKQNTVEWSEEDEYQINTILHGLDLKKELYKKEGNKVEEKRYSTQYDWLKFLKERVQHHPKQDWSEEDEKILKRIDNLLYSLCQIHGSEYEKLHNWLKSLKPNNWKPNEEQMQALETAVRCRTMPWEQLGTLYNDLKNL